MQSPLTRAALATALLSLAAGAAAQSCYETQHRCFTFGPPPGEVDKLDIGHELDLPRSEKLTVEGDLRLRLRAGDTRGGHPYNGTGHQQAWRGRVRLRYQATEQIQAFAEFNFSETWAGSDSYSDALAGEDFNGVSQFYLHAQDMLGFEDEWVIGRQEYILGNGLILGSCDFLQRPGTFTGVWVSRKICEHDLELFVFDDYGPLQAMHPGVRYIGGTASLNFGETCGKVVQAIKPYYLHGTDDGEEFAPAANPTEDDAWVGVDGTGMLPCEIEWHAEWALRMVDVGDDLQAWRATIGKKLGLFDGVLDTVTLQHTDSEGKMDVGNPADYNSAGLVHQYGGAWRSDLQTTQLGIVLLPGADIRADVNLLLLDRRGNSPQLGDFEADFIIGRRFHSGVYLSAGYGVDNDRRQVGYFTVTLNF